MEESMNYKELDEALETLNASENIEVVNEVTLKTNKYFGLGMNPDYHHAIGYALDPYVKVFNNPSYHKATKSIDVSIVKGIAFHHPNDRKPELKFGEGGWKEFLDESIREVIDPVNSFLCENKPGLFYGKTEMNSGVSLEKRRPYRIYELVFDTAIHYCMAYKQQVIELYWKHPDPLEYTKVLVYKK